MCVFFCEQVSKLVFGLCRYQNREMVLSDDNLSTCYDAMLNENFCLLRKHYNKFYSEFSTTKANESQNYQLPTTRNYLLHADFNPIQQM